MRRSSPQQERVSVCICQGWTVGACSLSSKGSLKPTPQNHLLLVLDGAPSHRSEEIVCPDNVDFLRLPAYSPELDPVERWFQEFRRQLSNRAFETVELLQESLDQALRPYWEDLSRLQRLTGFSWWVEAVNTL
jgi:transposase